MAIDHIRDLTPDPANARRHTSRNVGMIASAMNEVGAARSIVIDEDNVIMAGNATVDAAAQAGITRVRVVDADGDEVIAVRRSGLTPAQKTRLALFDNRAAELAEWDEGVLAALVDDEATDLAGIFRDDELAAILGRFTGDDPAEHWGGMPAFEQDDRTAIKTINVSFYAEADIAAFGRLVGQSVTMQTRGINYPIPGRAAPSGQVYADGS